MKILLTGGNGFLGRFVHKELLTRKYTDILIPRSSEYNLTNMENVSKLVNSYKPDTIIHLAADVGGIGANMNNPGKFFYNNMSMGLNLIESARLNNINKFVQIGTVCSYPKYCKIPFDESDLWNGYPEETNAPYGIAKKALYVMLQAYYQQYGLKSCVLIPTNLYGPYDNFNDDSSHVIPALIKKFAHALNNKTDSIICWGDGSATREFLYVEDAARGIVDGMEKIDQPIPINLGSGEEISIKDLSETIRDMLQYKGKIIWDRTKPNGQPKRKLNISRAYELLNWKNTTPLFIGMSRTIEWYLSQ